MAIPTFTAPSSLGVSFGSQVAYKPRILKAQFGNGYAQRAADGLNANPATFTMTMTNLKRTEAQTVNDFFVAQAGYKAFYYTLPGEVTPKKWVCEQWNYTYVDAKIDGVQATLTQVFDP
jgi:phage-related protein